MARVERYGPGEEAVVFDPGDFILTHRHNLIAGLISFGQKRHFRGADAAYAHWSHCALMVARDGALIEAESTGVRRSPISKYKGDEYHLVRLGSGFTPEARAQSVEYANARVGRAFGYLALIGTALFLVFGWRLKLIRRDHQICSGLLVRALQAGGLMTGVDAALALPADIAKMYEIRP